MTRVQLQLTDVHATTARVCDARPQLMRLPSASVVVRVKETLTAKVIAPANLSPKP